MKRSIIAGLLLASGCSDYGIEKIPPDLDEAAEDLSEAEEDEPEIVTSEVEVLDPPILPEDDEEPEEEPCGSAPTDDCDFDGYTPEDGDCDDWNAAVHPFAGDFYGDGVDQDCDSLDCEADEFGGVYYAFCPDTRLNWSDSYDLCVNSGYDSLAGIHDEETQVSINLILQDSGKSDSESPWVNINSVGSGVWASGESIDYTNWAPSEPNGLEDFCGHINRADADLGAWNDVPCDDEAWSMICEVVI